MIIKIVLAFFLVFPQVTVDSQRSPVGALPRDNEVEGWTKLRSMRLHVGENLYEYINGGAEIYHEYGFAQVVVQDYINDAGKSVSVEIYEMASPQSAYGMYTFKTDSKGKRIPVGNDAQLSDYYMNYWQGSYLVTLTGFDETEETRAGLLNIARSISPKLPWGGNRPRMIFLLPEEGLVAQSTKYFTGFLGLRNSHPFFSLNIMGYQEGVKGDYAGGFSLFLFRFEEKQESLKAYLSLKGQKDRRGRSLFVDTQREYVMLVLGDANPDQAKQVFNRLAEKIHEHE